MLLASLALVLSLSTAAQDLPPKQDDKDKAPTKKTDVTLRRTDGYPLDHCVVSGKPLPADAIEFTTGDRPFKVCSPACRERIEKEPQPFVEQLAKAVIDAFGPDYPLETCPISRKPLAGKGKPVDVVLGNTLVKLCCAECEPRLQGRRRGMPVTMNAAVAGKANERYTVTGCPVCDGKLLADAIWVQHGTSLLKLCGDACHAKFTVTPNAIVSKWRATRNAAAKPATPETTPPKADGEKRKDEQGERRRN